MGVYNSIKCYYCNTNIQTSVPIEYCPVCKEYILDKLHLNGGGTGINLPQAPK